MPSILNKSERSFSFDKVVVRSGETVKVSKEYAEKLSDMYPKEILILDEPKVEKKATKKKEKDAETEDK